MAKKEIKERYYYKDQNGRPAYNLKEPLANVLEDTTGYVEITKAEWDELTYVAPHVPTAAELAREEKLNAIAAAKAYLASTDYIVIKIAEAEDAEEIASIREEYADIIAERKAKRALINELEAELQ